MKPKFPVEQEIGPQRFTRWLQPRMDKYFLACCDCGLVHQLEFRIVGDRVQYRARRAVRHTAQQRKRKGGKPC